MEEIREFLSIMGIFTDDTGIDDVMKALLGAFGPKDPGALSHAWRNRPGYGRSVPTAQEFWDMYERADFRCSECRSQRRLTLDHQNRDTTDHSPDNLVVLCFDCNRARSNRPTINKDARLRLYRSAVKLHRQLNRFPTRREILADSGVTRTSGATYMLKYLEARLQAQSKSQTTRDPSQP